MNPHVERYRHSWRLRIPSDPGETRRIEQWLATARVILAVSALVAIRMDPTELGHSWAAYGLFVFYMANGILILMLLRRRQQSTAAFRLHGACGRYRLAGADFNLCRRAHALRSSFSLFLFWQPRPTAGDLWETLGTAAAEVALLWVESFVLLH